MVGVLRNWIDMPPVWMVGFVALIRVQVRLWNPLAYDVWILTLIGWGIIGLAVLLMGWAAVQFLLTRTTIVPRNTPTALIIKGPYRISRNPIYLADAMVVLGWSLVQGSALGLLLLPIFMAVITSRFIRGEEAGIREAYPQTQGAFFSNTRRWL